MHPEIKRGDLLIASASLLDPNFRRAVVLVCDHSATEGTFGLVLNRPVPVPTDVRESLPFEIESIYQGGPVRVEAMQVIHPYGERIPQCLQVFPGVWIGGAFDVLCRGFKEGAMDPRRCRFCLGYAGCGGGQLAEEFTQDAWLHVASSPALIYATPADKVWARAVRHYGESHPMFRFFPDDPTCN